MLREQQIQFPLEIRGIINDCARKVSAELSWKELLERIIISAGNRRRQPATGSQQSTELSSAGQPGRLSIRRA